ncbi:MAG: MepB family protein [Bdellovibrionales bacterium]
MSKAFTVLKELLGVREEDLVNYKEHLEALGYSGCEFELSQKKYVFRRAKLTPKKAGFFVTLWNRNDQGVTVPFGVDGKFDEVVVMCQEGVNKGFFVFSKEVLAKNKVLSVKASGGKRGFRVYPSWSKIQSKQAAVTQRWQLSFFSKLNPFV